MVTLYEVTVWDMNNGDVVKYARDVTEAQLSEIEQYYDEPWHSVVIDDEYESDDE